MTVKKKRLLFCMLFLLIALIVVLVGIINTESNEKDISDNTIPNDQEIDISSTETVKVNKYSTEIQPDDGKPLGDQADINQMGNKTEESLSNTELQNDEKALTHSNDSGDDLVNNNDTQELFNNEDEVTNEVTTEEADEDKEKAEDKYMTSEEESKKKSKLATDKPLIYVEDVKAKAGDSQVKVSIDVKNNPGVLGMTISVYYDEKNVSLNKVENGDAFDDVLTLTEANILKSGSNFMWDGQELSKEDIKDGTILELSFNVAENASSGIYPITVVCNSDDVIDKDLNPIKLTVVNGSIKID